VGPAAYGVYYVFEKQPDASDQPVNDRLSSIAAAVPPLTNVAFEAVDITGLDPDDLASQALLQLFSARSGQRWPMHVVVSPQRELVYAGRLQMSDVDALCTSPLRGQICELLAAGNVVLLLRPGSDPLRNHQADEVLRHVQAAARQAVGSPDVQPVPVELVTCPPGDLHESWLLRMLEAQRGSGDSRPDEPLVAIVYGRGRVLATYVGLDEIRVEALLGTGQDHGLRYLGTVCTAAETEDLPGSDLLTTWDWEDTAYKLAQRLGSGGNVPREPDMLALGPEAILGEAVSTDAAGPLAGHATTVPTSPSNDAPATPQPRVPRQQADDEQLAALLARNVLLGTTLVVVVLIVGTLFYIRPRG
jgi:hypothetical protein